MDRFHQYYVDGQTEDCSPWQENHQDCELWLAGADREAAARVITRERDRLAARLRPHFANTVWEKRTEPPADWDKELPEYMRERQEGSYLGLYQRQRDKEVTASHAELTIMEVQAKSGTSCAVM